MAIARPTAQCRAASSGRNLSPQKRDFTRETPRPLAPRKHDPMKVLLLHPEFPELFWSLKHILRFIAKRATLPALGLFTVAAMLPDKWETRLM
jgi:hypothetical protein